MKKEASTSIKQGLVWLGTASALMRVFELLTTLAIWWLLTKEQIGLAALSWSIAVVLEAFNGLGVGTALVQAKEVSRGQLNSLFWYTLGLAGVCAGGIIVGSPWIAGFFETPGLQPLIVVSSLRLVTMAVALIPLQILIRELRFKEVALVQTAALGLASLLKILLAYLGFGEWALVVAYAAEGGFVMVGVWILRPLWPRLTFAFREIRDMIVFGVKVAASGILYHGYRNLDSMFIGKLFGPEVLGVYKIAFDLAMLPATAVLDVVNRSAFPVYARLAQDKAALKDAYLWMVRNLALLVAPIVLFMFFGGREILLLIADGKWLAALPSLQILVWAALLRCLAQITPQLFHGAGRPSFAVVDSVTTMVSIALSLWLTTTLFGPTLGVQSAALSWLVTYPLVITVLVVLTQHIVRIKPSEYLKTFQGPVVMVAALLPVLAGVSAVLPAGIHPIVALLVKAGAELLVFGLVLRFGFKVTLRTLVGKETKA